MNNQNDPNYIQKIIYSGIKFNTLKKLNEKIAILSKKYKYIEYIQNENWKKSHFVFLCPDHGIFTLNGLEVRTNKDCPKCDYTKEENILNQYDNSDGLEREKILTERFPYLDWSDLNPKDFLDLDHIIRPSCIEHGEFITTPRKLIHGDKCKWCDGPKFNEEIGEYVFKLTKKEKLIEKIEIITGTPKDKINIYDNGLFGIETENNFNLLNLWELRDTNRFTKYPNYLNHLKEIKDPSTWDNIFFKLIIIDKSSKFQFTIVSRIELNESWNLWYKDFIFNNPGEEEEAQKIATAKIIRTWYSMVFYGKPEVSLKEETFSYEVVWSYWSNQTRTLSLENKYHELNKDKKIILSDQINSKMFHQVSALGIHTYWSENKWESTSNSVSLIRESLLKKSNICPICNRPINSPVVDHEHKAKIKGSGRIRDNICSGCNVFIAKAENNCKRFGISLEELPTVLKNVSSYFAEQQYNIIHYTDKDKRPVLSKTLANKILKFWEMLYPGKRKLKFPKSGVLTKDWEEAIGKFEEFEKMDSVPFSKLDYKKLLREIEIENGKRLEIINSGIAKTKKPKLLEYPEYPKLKMITPMIQKLIDEVNK